MIQLRGCVCVTLMMAGMTACKIIPREVVYGNPKYSEVSLSPDGESIGYISLDEHGIRNIYVQCVTCTEGRPVTAEKNNILDFQWTGVPNIIIFKRDNDGDENHLLYKLNITRSNPPHKPFAVSNLANVKTSIIKNDKRHRTILIGLNDDGPKFHDVYEFDLITNQLKMIMKNKRFPLPLYVDNDLKVRLAFLENTDGTTQFYRVSDSADPSNLTSEDRDWIPYLKVSQSDAHITQPIGFSGDNKRVYWLWGQGTDLGQLVVHDFGHPDRNEVLHAAKKAEVDYEYDDEIDNSDILIHPVDKTVLAVTEAYHKPEIYILNETVRGDFDYLSGLKPITDSPLILGVSQDFCTWLVTYVSDRIPYEIYLYRRPERAAKFLLTTRPDLKGWPLNRMVGFDFVARDNLTLQAYLSLPPDTPLRKPSELRDRVKAGYAARGLLPSRPQKMVVHVHGGPQSRDRFGYSRLNAWLTNRGYAILQVNFRGSKGLGKRLLNAGDGEWGRKMHWDILDAVNFAVDNGIAERSQVVIMGGSYGGYEALVAMTQSPEVFACGVDIVGPSNLVTLMRSIPPYWFGFYNQIKVSIGGDVNTNKGRKFLRGRSPLFFADRVRKPLLILQGANDPRVPRHESDEFVAALRGKGIPVTYVLFPDEGHGFRKQANSLAEAGFIERFLHRCVGGHFEQFVLGQYNSSALVLADADGFYGSTESNDQRERHKTHSLLPKPTSADGFAAQRQQ